MSNHISENYTVNLFHHLSERFHDENSLSDFTFALAYTIPHFTRFICDFFKVPVLKDEPIEIEREFIIEGTQYRVDLAFLFRKSQRRFLLENKIWDRDYHFDNYSKAIGRNPKVSLGIISNHQISSESLKTAKGNWKVKYWPEFIEGINPSEYADAQPLMEGYITYVKKVCSMKTIEKIEFDENALVSLRYFNNLIKKIVTTLKGSSFDCIFIKEACGHSWSGVLYSVGHSDSKNQIRAWFGIDYEERPTISISLHNHWNRHLNTELFKIGYTEDNDFLVKDRRWKRDFEMPSNKFQDFLQATCESQEEILLSFFKDVNSQFAKQLMKYNCGNENV